MQIRYPLSSDFRVSTLYQHCNKTKTTKTKTKNVQRSHLKLLPCEILIGLLIIFTIRMLYYVFDVA